MVQYKNIDIGWVLMRKIGLVLLIICLVILSSCVYENDVGAFNVVLVENTSDITIDITPVPTCEQSIEPTNIPTPTPIDYNVKYIFLFIGDGMGDDIIRLSNDILEDKHNKALSFTEFHSQGKVSTELYNGDITDSAAAGTAIASGIKTKKGAIGVNVDGQNVESIIEYANDKGMKTGVITTVTVDHATPAAFYAHQSKRTKYEEILQDAFNSDLNVIAGSYTSAGLSNEELTEMSESSDKELRFVEKDDSFTEEKGIYLTQVPYAKDNDFSNATLYSILKHSVENLYNDNGFIIMAESGKIDWANHQSDWVDAVNEIFVLDDAVQYALDFYEKHPEETMIIVTSDHETGGFIYDDDVNVDVYDNVKTSYEGLSSIINEAKGKGTSSGFSYLKDYLTNNFGFGFDDAKDCIIPITSKNEEDLYDAFKYYVRKDKSTSYVYKEIYQIINDFTGEIYTTDYHTKEPVSIYAIGRYSELFEGEYENVDIYSKLKEILDTEIAD